jgi:S1-C subfamily serine protease
MGWNALPGRDHAVPRRPLPMKLRPVVLVLLLLTAFYYLTSRMAPAGTLAGLLHGESANTSNLNGPLGDFSMTEAKAAPAFDTEEQQNISVYKRVLPSVVNITSTEVQYDFFYRPIPQQGLGSGFILDKQGHILTNNHVIDNAQKVEVKLYNQKTYRATVLQQDRANDLALLQIQNAPDLQPATLADSGGLVVGQQVYAVGNPFGFSGTMTRGIISALRSVQLPNGNKINNAIQTDASVNPGNSGGPLLNSRGEVIGITTMIASNPNGGAEQSAGIGFAIPINTAKAVLDDIARYGRVRRPSLDVVILPIGPDLAEQIGLPADYGILIQRVLPGGAADRAGLHGGKQRAYLDTEPIALGGDLIVAIDGQEITNPQDFSNALNTHHTGDTVTITAYRGRQRMNFKVTLTDASEKPGGQTI